MEKKSATRYIVDSNIVTVVANILCNSNERGSTWMKYFIVSEDEIETSTSDEVLLDFISDEEKSYTIEIKNMKQFCMVVDALSTSCSFRAISRIMDAFTKHAETNILGRPSEGDIGTIVRHLVAINLMALSKILNKVWCFSIGTDGANHDSEGYMDVRISFGYKGKLENYHLLAIPMGKIRHTGANYAELVIKLLSNIVQSYQEKLLGTTSDGASVMMGCNNGFNTLIVNHCQEVNNGDRIYVNWCGCHQLNLKVSNFLEILDQEVDFRAQMTSIISYTRSCETFYSVHGKAKTYAETRWHSIYKSIKYVCDKRSAITNFYNEKGKALPPTVWWFAVL